MRVQMTSTGRFSDDVVEKRQRKRRRGKNGGKTTMLLVTWSNSTRSNGPLEMIFKSHNSHPSMRSRRKVVLSSKHMPRWRLKGSEVGRMEEKKQEKSNGMATKGKNGIYGDHHAGVRKRWHGWRHNTYNQNVLHSCALLWKEKRLQWVGALG